jgi:RNA polymerase sigma-70 factor (ECF subfamily)
VISSHLIEACCSNDRKAQKGVYNILSGKLYSSSLKYASSNEDAQDILQDAFITIFKKIEQFNHKGSFEGWCRRIVINTALAKYRSNKIKTVDQDRIINLEVEIEVEEVSEISLNALLEFIQELPDRYRLVFSLYTLDDYSHQEIADLMQISVGTSKSNLSRAKVILQEKINTWRQANSSNNSNAS